MLVEVLQHQAGRQDQRGRVGDALAGDVRRRAVNRLEDGRFSADVGAGREAETAHQPGHLVREDVAEHVLRHDDVELIRIHHQLHRRGVDDPVVELDTAFVFLRDLPADLEEQPVRALQDVGLVHERHLPAIVRERVFERIADDPLRPVTRDDHHGLGDGVRVLADPDVVLDADVETLGVLPHDHEIDVVVARVGLHRDRRPHVGVQVEVLAQRDVDGAEAGAHGRGQRALQGDPVALDRIQRFLRQRVPEGFSGVHAGDLALELQRCARGLENAHGGVHDLRADAVAGNQRNCGCHLYLVVGRRRPKRGRSRGGARKIGAVMVRREGIPRKPVGFGYPRDSSVTSRNCDSYSCA